MDEKLILQARDFFLLVLLGHFRSKTLDKNLHDETKGLYEGRAFDVFHQMAERFEDNGSTITDWDDAGQIGRSLYDAAEKLKEALEAAAAAGDSVGTDNLVRGLADVMEGVCGDLRKYTVGEYAEKEDEND